MKKLFFLVLVVALLMGTTTVLAGPPAGVPRGRPKGVSHGPPEWASASSLKGASTGASDKGKSRRNGPAGNSNVAHLYLREKDPSDWSIVEGGAWGKMKYNQEGPTFDFVFNGHGLEPNIEYSLIYYADFEDRYNVWGGNNPGALIESGTSNDGGNIHLKGCVNLDMDLPSEPDANIDTHDYSGAPDYYTNAHGAKIWLVPSDCYVADEKRVGTWSPDKFLFETDLITYTDTDKP